MHLHYPQPDVIGSQADGLLPWLENHTLPHKKRFVVREYAASSASIFVAELHNGVIAALAFATSHPSSVDALLGEAARCSLRMIAGKVLMDQNSPKGVRDDIRQSLIDTEELIKKWHGAGCLGYAITPLLARKTTQAASLDEMLFALIVLCDDRVIEKTVISQASEALADEIANG